MRVQVFRSPELWIIVAGYSAAVHVGKLSPAIPVFRQAFDLSLLQAGLALSLVQAAGMLFALLIGAFSAHIGLKRCLITGLCALGLASSSSLLIDHVVSLFFFRFIEGLGFLLVTLSAPAILKQICAPETMSLKMGIWSSYMGLGVCLALLSIPVLFQYFDWKSVWFFLGIFSFLLAFCCHRFVHVARPSTSFDFSAFWDTVKVTIRHPPIVCLALIFACYTSQWLTMIGFLPSIYLSHHIRLELAGVLTAGVAFVNVVGTLTAGYLMQRGMKSKQLMIFGFSMMCLGSWLALEDAIILPFALQYLGVIFFSLFGGFIPTVVFAICLNCAPRANAVASSFGLVLQVSALGQFMIPPLSGLLVGHTHDWSNIAWISTVLSATGIVIVTLLMTRYQKIA
ncbi:MFS transporter [Acinetobacter rudis]|uniref:MFS transporter n=1 Tax=Acinetobacter rudis TaxID=632955 RepID=UPI00280E4259|nr:MFS transporter [Acinetobacter rudis]MDQ8954445.1 MFS transporter [Acinetobacter rudis]